MRNQKDLFKGRHFTHEIILWAVRWYLQFPISHCDLEFMLADRGVVVDASTVFRWVQAYAPEMDKPIRPHLGPTIGSCPGGWTRPTWAIRIPMGPATDSAADYLG